MAQLNNNLGEIAQMTRFNKFLLTHLCKGVAVGWGLLAVFLISNLGGVGTLIFKSSNTVMAVGLLALGFAITFGSCAMGLGVMKYLPESKGKKT
ncbi:MAG: hypothetical protein L3J65_08465 [Robiginitomaculum sp.]|nr:hypothetical protein [Robiginitomaculum sp.]